MVAINTSFPNTSFPNMGSSSSGSGTSASSGSPSGAGGFSPSAPTGFPSVRYSPPPSSPGPIAKVRHAIQQRAAVELTDTFRRMEVWGASAKALPAGWSRHPDGYVRTGQLALYRPSQSFSDYRFEF